MDWKAIRQHLLSALGYDLEITGSFGRSKRINLTMWPGSPRNLTFETLGSGSMKRVVRVAGEDWVLALAGDSPAAEKDMQGEITTLLELSAGGVRVPEPFVSGMAGEILFKLKLSNTDSGDEKVYPAFLQQFLPYQEMDKLRERSNFAQDFILAGGIPSSIEQTVTDLKAILARLKVREWGDFQVIYQRVTGYVYVFDPLPDNNSGTSSIPIVSRWLKDIEDARDLVARNKPRPPKAIKTAGGAWEV